MVRRKRQRSDVQRAYRRTNERLNSLQKKVEEFNVLTEGRMCIIWRYKDEMSTFGDQQLVKSLTDNSKPTPPSASPTSSTPSSTTSSTTSSATSSTASSTTPLSGLSPIPAAELGLILDDDILGTDWFQHRPRPVIPARWKMEDLDLLAVDFFGIAGSGCVGSVLPGGV